MEKLKEVLLVIAKVVAWSFVGILQVTAWLLNAVFFILMCFLAGFGLGSLVNRN